MLTVAPSGMQNLATPSDLPAPTAQSIVTGNVAAEDAEANARHWAGTIVFKNFKGFFLTKKMYKPKYTNTTCMISPVHKAATRYPNCSKTFKICVLRLRKVRFKLACVFGDMQQIHDDNNSNITYVCLLPESFSDHGDHSKWRTLDNPLDKEPARQ